MLNWIFFDLHELVDQMPNSLEAALAFENLMNIELLVVRLELLGSRSEIV